MPSYIESHHPAYKMRLKIYDYNDIRNKIEKKILILKFYLRATAHAADPSN